MAVAYLVGELSRLNYNAWYGFATKQLVDTIVTQVEDGNIDRTMRVLQRLNLEYQPTYENRAHYDELVKEAVAQMNDIRDLKSEGMDASPFTRETWQGHWQSDRGYWIVIDHIGDFKVVRSGDSMAEFTDFVISEDRRSLAFTEGNQRRHELTLANKYEAKHVWRDLEDSSVWETDVLHKLRRATPEERAFTQQKE